MMRKLMLVLVLASVLAIGFAANIDVVDAQDGDCPQNPWNFNPVIGQTLIVDEPGVTGHTTIGGRSTIDLTMGERVQVISMPECDDGESLVRVNYQGENLWVVFLDNPIAHVSGGVTAYYYLVPNDDEESVLMVNNENPRCPQDPYNLNLRSGLVMVVDEPNVFTYQAPRGNLIQRLDIGTQVRLTGSQLCYDTELWSSATLDGEAIWIKVFDNNTMVNAAGGVVATYHFMPQGDVRAENQDESDNHSSPSDQTSSGSSTYQVASGYTVQLKNSLEEDARITATLEAGDQVTLIETVESGNTVAARVRYQGQTGWVLFSAGGVNYFEYID